MAFGSVPLSSLASVFQLVAGAALALSVFTAPLESAVRSTGDKIKREGRIIVNRSGDAVDTRAQKLADIRIHFQELERSLQERVLPWTRLVWGTAAASATALVASSLLPDLKVDRLIALLTVIAPIISLVGSYLRVEALAAEELAPVENELKSL